MTLYGHNPCRDGEHTFVWGNYGCNSPRIVAECITCHQFLLGFDPATDVSVDLEGSMDDTKPHEATLRAVMEAFHFIGHESKKLGVQQTFDGASDLLGSKIVPPLRRCPLATCGREPEFAISSYEYQYPEGKPIAFGRYECRAGACVSHVFPLISPLAVCAEPDARAGWNRWAETVSKRKPAPAEPEEMPNLGDWAMFAKLGFDLTGDCIAGGLVGRLLAGARAIVDGRLKIVDERGKGAGAERLAPCPLRRPGCIPMAFRDKGKWVVGCAHNDMAGFEPIATLPFLYRLSAQMAWNDTFAPAERSAGQR